MKLAVSAVAALLLLAETAHAQPPTPDPGKLALAHQLIVVQGGEPAMRRQMNALIVSMNRAAAASMPPDAAKFAAPMQEAIHKQVLSMIPALIDASAKAWADNLSEQELRDYIAFQSSPTGRSIQSKAPAIMDEVMQTTMPLIAAKMPVLMEDAVRQMCVEQHCTADQQRVIAEAITHAAHPGKPAG